MMPMKNAFFRSPFFPQVAAIQYRGYTVEFIQVLILSHSFFFAALQEIFKKAGLKALQNGRSTHKFVQKHKSVRYSKILF